MADSEGNTRRIIAIENCFGRSGQPLLSPGRVLLAESALIKRCRKQAKPRKLFLFNDILVYGNIVTNNKKYKKQRIISLEEVKWVNLEDEKMWKNGWVILSASKSFVVYAATPSQKAEWIEKIEKCVTDLLGKTGKQPIEAHAPVWVPDNEAKKCKRCKSEFSFVIRRHHGRNDGKIYCGNCCYKKFLLPAISKKPVRVCNRCYKLLNSGLGNQAQDQEDSDVSDTDDEDGNSNTDFVSRLILLFGSVSFQLLLFSLDN